MNSSPPVKPIVQAPLKLNEPRERLRLRLLFSYDGTAYRGWQRQTQVRNTIQETMESALSRLFNDRLHCVASGRTDAGVHARIQVAHSDVPHAAAERLVLSGRLVHALNSILPATIRVLDAHPVSFKFHARKGVERKTYLYFIDTTPIQWPAVRQYTWSLRLPLNWSAIEQATLDLNGTHDFKAFCDADSTVKTTERTLFEAYWGDVSDAALSFAGPGLPQRTKVLRLTGNGFLKHMVRSIVGTLIKIGQNQAPPGLVASLLANPTLRRQAGPTAPAHGLWLWDIRYDKT